MFVGSEKPPLSYNQYLWRDQVVDFIDGVVRVAYAEEARKAGADFAEVPVLLGGNSIGGFTAASVAAELAVRQGLQGEGRGQREGPAVRCVGLVLFNPSGRMEQAEGKEEKEKVAAEVDQDQINALYFPPYRGPAPELLRLFGRGVVTLLQPRIQKTCEWLYPARPERVAGSGLADIIFRDSCDPGAADIIASGGITRN